MQQTIINGYQVTIFTGYHGTQLFITHPAGDNIYAHKVAGDPMQRAREVIAQDAPAPVVSAPVAADRMICISERKAEFVDALNRAKDSNLEVYSDWDRDAFVVVNTGNQAEYRVRLETRKKRLFVECECPDFIYRKRVCKHISEVLTNALFTVNV